MPLPRVAPEPDPSFVTPPSPNSPQPAWIEQAMNWPTAQQAAAMSPQRAAATIRLHEDLARDAVDLAETFQKRAEGVLSAPLPATHLLTAQQRAKRDARLNRRLMRHHQDRAVHHHGIVERIRKAHP